MHEYDINDRRAIIEGGRMHNNGSMTKPHAFPTLPQVGDRYRHVSDGRYMRVTNLNGTFVQGVTTEGERVSITLNDFNATWRAVRRAA